MTRTMAVLMSAAPTVALDFDGIDVEVVAAPWPKAMPEARACYQRALDHPWTWKQSRRVAPNHQAFVWLQAAGSDDAVQDMMVLTRAAAEVAALPGALCLFVPDGEALRPIDRVQSALRQLGTLPAPVDLWVNTRLASLGPRWQAMDTVGMRQLDRPDFEALYDTATCDYRAVDAFLKNLCFHVLDKGALGDGDRLPGPDGSRWEARAAEESLMEPARPVLQLAAEGGPGLPVVTKV